ENIFDRSRMAPKTPIKNEPVDLSKQKGCTPERNPITPVKLTDRPQPDPWTPTANLKMLISAASPDMRDREKKKELFRPIENSKQETSDCLQYDMVDDSVVDEFEKQRPSRKQKSLGLLCQKFLARYPSYPLSTEKTTISLDEVASILGVERRRIYDIVNVLESLHLVSRVAKNQYCWHGRHNLGQTLKRLQEAGELQYGELMAFFQHKEQDLDYTFAERRKDTSLDSQDRPLLDFSEPDCTSASANSRKDKSLRIMSQKFVMLFLVSKTKIVTLDIAAKILIEESQDTVDHSKFKTKVRRLYDIANVLTSLGLIKKVHVTEERGRKPAFKWIGPVEFRGKREKPRGHSPTSDHLPEIQREACAPYQTCASGKQRFTCHASLNDAQPCEGTKKKLLSEPNSPHQGKRGNYQSDMFFYIPLACATETILNSGKNQSINLPLSLLPVPGDSDFCVKPLPHALFPVVQSDLPGLSLPNSITSQALRPPVPESKMENGKPTLLPNQPFLCFPSSSLFMLCGGLQESVLKESHAVAGNAGNRSAREWASPHKAQAAEAPVHSQKRSSHRCPSPSAPMDNEEPLAKKQPLEQSNVPLSLVVPKEPLESPEAESTPGSGSTSAVHLEAFHLDLTTPAAPEAEDKETTKSLDPQEQEKASQNKDPSEPSPGKEHICKENANQPFPPQYLYVQPTAGLSSLNFLFSANQAPGAVGLAASHLPSLSVPCVVVPSAALASFPLVCSPAIPSPLSPVPDSSAPAAASLNLGVSGLASAAPVFIGPTAVVPPKASQSPPDPQQPAQPPVHLSPVLARAGSAVKLDSPVYMGHPVTFLKLQQPLTAPLTPKSIRPAHHEAFFKTPGSLGDPIAWKKSEGIQTRNASSVQRRLEISTASTD
ncbi:E2F7 factor, partial [Crypturellus soui]|nr:E2F7 factor [Crypturellus soui]